MTSFISQWLAFSKTHRHEMSDNYSENVKILPENHCFLAPYKKGYRFAFNNGKHKLFYSYRFINGIISVHGPYILINNTKTPCENKICISNVFMDQLYDTMMTRQHQFDIDTLETVIEYKPFMGGIEDSLQEEFKLFEPITYNPCHQLSMFLHVIHAVLQPNDVMVCSFGCHVKDDHIYFIATKFNVSSLSLENGNLVTTEIMTLNYENSVFTVTETTDLITVPFTFKDKDIVKTFTQI
uniref:Uncharacterized protein n=1 Tax=Rhinella marina erythrocytic-like virus TaxID=2859906 RepID=A0A8F6UAC5_9VIRU|nr:hypothetical protein RMELV043 [Rhinella marina erythrocytic-like virus]